MLQFGKSLPMKRYKRYFIILFIILLLIIIGFKIFKYIELRKTSLLNSYFQLQSLSLSEKLSIEILRKKESTTNIAISIANNDDLLKRIIHRNIPTSYFKPLIEKLKKRNQYKNIWIQIIDKRGVILYNSWENKKKNISNQEKNDRAKAYTLRKTESSINIDKYDLSFMTTVPIFKDDIFLGYIKLISRFNSISKKLQAKGIGSVVVAIKNKKEQLSHPFSKNHIGKYYVANINAPKKLLNYLLKHDIKKYLNNSYKIENNYLIVSYPLKNRDLKVIGYYIMFQKTNNLQNKEVNIFLFKLFMIIVIVILFFIIIGALIFININRKQKRHYKNIIDSSTNIVIIHNLSKIISVNKAFFRLFNEYDTLQTFLNNHKCISDFFCDEEECLQKYIDKEPWIMYLVKNQNKTHKVKIFYNNKTYYFLISASLIDEDLNQYSIILTDTTKQEMYKKKLESLTVTDALTKIKNRRYFQAKLEEEINSALRYNYPLSLIMTDIDYFKKINDQFGHQVGDKVLKEYTNTISSLLRKEDTFCRIGGEEFVIILPHVDIQNAVKTAEKLRVRVQYKKEVVPITMSFGVTQYIPNEEIETLYKRVDKALYDAKKGGRNRVVATRG